LEEAQRAKPRPRIESLSDLVFGLALSIGAIALATSPPTTEAGLYRDILTFGFNFIVLISIWLRYTRIMSALPIETRTTMVLNTVLLFAVILEPFLFNIIRSGNSATPPSIPLFEASSSLYGIDLGAMMLIMGIFTLALADEERRLVQGEMISELQSEAVMWFISSCIFLVSAIPIFGRIEVGGVLVTGLSVRTIMWLGAIAVSWVMRGVRMRFGPD
jgi:uncharacterized membrane protein